VVGTAGLPHWGTGVDISQSIDGIVEEEVLSGLRAGLRYARGGGLIPFFLFFVACSSSLLSFPKWEVYRECRLHLSQNA
jgi:hypothetical protein